MPTYIFHNIQTGVVEEKVMKIAEKEQYLKDNPSVEQVHTGINIVAGVGGIKSDSGWKDNLSRIAEAHPRSALAERHGKKSIKDIKTKQVVEKHLNKKRKK
tara:strand:+ start:474 stop:776 length:303 start_codon:yes stop_codon:yes gene_type:complete